jgi:hypothetical protein
MWDNRSALGGAGNTTRGLTRSLDLTKEGLPVKGTCSIDGCDTPARTRGWCNAHHIRFLRHGDPLAPRLDGRNQTVEQRFWGKVARRGPDECWMWTGLPKATGYGYLTVDRRHIPAHRLSWSINNGRDIPDGLWVLHSCDTPMCVNPAHLRLGDHQENMRDVARRLRAAGERNSFHKLTEADVLAIRADYARGVSSAELAARHSVVRQTIIGIVARTAWRHLPEAEGRTA